MLRYSINENIYYIYSIYYIMRVIYINVFHL
jgi:hypothetical protein